LQVNYQKRGTNHPGSADFVHELRNDVIQMCNDSQKDLTDLMSRLRYDYSAKQELKDKILYAPQFIQCLIYILDILCDVFKEVEDIGERLEKDKIDFKELKVSATILNDQINPYRSKFLLRSLREIESEGSSIKNYANTHSSSNSSTTNYRNNNYSSRDSNKNSNEVSEKSINTMLVIAFIMSLVAMIVCGIKEFILGTITAAVVFMAVVITSSMWSRGSISKKTMSGISITLVIVMGVMLLAGLVSSDKSKQNSTYGVTLNAKNFENYFTLSSSCSLYTNTAYYTYSITPKYSFDYSDYNNPSSITLTIGLDISGLRYQYGTPTEYKIYITLYKYNDYKASGNKTYSISSDEDYWADGIYSVSNVTIYP